MELETINRLFLELSQFAEAETKKEIDLRKQLADKSHEIWNLKESEAGLKHLLGEALVDKESLEDYKRQYPPDFIEKMQQDIDERNVTIKGLRQELSDKDEENTFIHNQWDDDREELTNHIAGLETERSSLMKILAQWYFSSMRHGWETGHTEGEVMDEIVDYFANSLHPEWPSGYDAEKTVAAVDRLTEEE